MLFVLGHVSPVWVASGQVLVTNFLPQTDLAPVLHRQAEAGVKR